MEVQLHARRLLSHASPTIPSPGPARSVAEGGSPASSFSSLDATVVTVLSLLLCSLVVALVLNAVVRCAFRVTRHVCYGQEPPELAGQGGPETTCRRPSPVRALPALAYSAELELAGSASECAICLAEFARGAHVRVLPRCNHGFHVRCIDRWLAARQTCPTCRQEPFAKPALPGTAVVPAEQLEAHDGTSQRMAL